MISDANMYDDLVGFSACQGLSHDLEGWYPKLAVVKIFGAQFFRGDHKILRLQPSNIYLLNEIKHNIHIQCNGNGIEVKIMYLKLTL